MKQRTKNLLDKVRRLSSRLISVRSADTLEKQKKYFQFRLVGVEDISTTIKKALDEKVGNEVIDALRNDITAQIEQANSALAALPDKLSQELEHLADVATFSFPKDNDGKFLLSRFSDEQKSISQLWKDNITYNKRWYTEQVTKMKAGLDDKVRPVNDLVHTILSNAINKLLIICLELFAPVFVTDQATEVAPVRQKPTSSAKTDEFEPRKPSRSKARRQK